MKNITINNKRFEAKLNAFKKRKEQEGKSVSNIDSVTSHAREFVSFLEHRNISSLKKITQSTIDDYFEYLQLRHNQTRGGGLSSSSLNKHREGVLRFMEFIYDARVGESHFFINVFKIITELKEIPTEAEVSHLFSICEYNFKGIRMKAILSLLYGCGLRKAEAHRLNVSDINLFNNTLRVQKSKNGRQRDVNISPVVKEYIEEYLYQAREHLLRDDHQTDAFILSNYGRRLGKGSLYLKVKALGVASGIDKPLTPHLLRHAIGTHLVGHLTIEEIASFLGHNSIDSSQLYTHIKFTKNN